MQIVISKQEESKKSQAEASVPLEDPFTAIQRRNDGQMAKFQEQIAQAVTSAITDALRRVDTQRSEATSSQPNRAPSPQASSSSALPSTNSDTNPTRPLPQVTIEIGPATNTSCGQFGLGSGPMTGNQEDLLQRLPERKRQFGQDVMPRLIAAAKGDIANPDGQGNVIDVLNG